MLNWIKIKNLALIEEADVEFNEGFNVITGETGAGKSILLSTVALLLGERADKGVIRTGAQRCEISAGITIPGDLAASLRQALEKSDISFDAAAPEVQLRRVITRNQTRNFINDTPVTLHTLKNIGGFLIDIHAANEHQSLLSQTRQLELLDRYAGLEDAAAQCAAICKKLSAVKQEKERAFAAMPSTIEAEHLRMIVEEIEKVSPEPGELEELNARHQLAANAKTVMELTGESEQMLTGSEDAVADRLGAVYRHLQELSRIDPAKTAPLLEQCDQISEMLRELSGNIEDFSANIELNEQELIELEDRLSAVHTLTRRYGPGLENVFAALANARERLTVFQDAEKLRMEYADKEHKLSKELAAQAKKLSAARQKIAGELAEKVAKKLRVLGFLKSSLEIVFSAIEPGERGCDRVDFMFSANPGEALQPLRNIASSGEISRVMLALKTVLADADDVPVLIFDEIDVNIGGSVANRVGEELKTLAAQRQVLCISHLAQVAARGKRHFAVSKKVRDGRTTSSISELSGKYRQQEIARMLGGGSAADAHAADLLKSTGN